MNIVRRNYSEIAGHYSETRKKPLWPELAGLIDGIEPGAKVLDAGCGSGRLLAGFAGKDVRYLGIDACRELLEEARERFPGHEFRANDILRLGEVPELDFDYVFCVAVLQHIPGKDLRLQVLRQLRNKVSRKGKVIITVWNLRGQEKYRKLIWRFWLLKLIGKNRMDFGDILFDWKSPDCVRTSRRYYHAFGLSELKKLAKKAGLSIEKIHKDERNIYAVMGRIS